MVRNKSFHEQILRELILEEDNHYTKNQSQKRNLELQDRESDLANSFLGSNGLKTAKALTTKRPPLHLSFITAANDPTNPSSFCSVTPRHGLNA